MDPAAKVVQALLVHELLRDVTGQKYREDSGQGC